MLVIDRTRPLRAGGRAVVAVASVALSRARPGRMDESESEGIDRWARLKHNFRPGYGSESARAPVRGTQSNCQTP